MWKSERQGFIASDFIDGDGYYDGPQDAEETAEVLGKSQKELEREAGSRDWAEIKAFVAGQEDYVERIEAAFEAWLAKEKVQKSTPIFYTFFMQKGLTTSVYSSKLKTVFI